MGKDSAGVKLLTKELKTVLAEIKALEDKNVELTNGIQANNTKLAELNKQKQEFNSDIEKLKAGVSPSWVKYKGRKPQQT